MARSKMTHELLEADKEMEVGEGVELISIGENLEATLTEAGEVPKLARVRL